MSGQVSLEAVLGLAKRCAGNPAAAVHQIGQIAAMLRALPANDAWRKSRYEFECASLYTMPALFQNLVTERAESIRMQTDMWVRGVVGWCMLDVPYDDQAPLDEAGAFGNGIQRVSQYAGQCCRPFFEASYTLRDDVGFISDGASETFAPAVTILGDGRWYAPMDWKLQRNDTVIVRVRNRTAVLSPEGDATVYGIRGASVAFWGEPLDPRDQQRIKG